MEQARLLFCDYDGDFELAKKLSRSGYLIDQIRPDGLRSVAVGDHIAFVFHFAKPESTSSVLKTCEKLKAAELSTPIILVCREKSNSDFLNHRQAPHHADFYFLGDEVLKDLASVLTEQLGAVPASDVPDENTERTEILSKTEKVSLKDRLVKLEQDLESALKESEKLKRELKAHRDSVKPKLKALLEGEKKKAQTETERLKVRLSEIEAKLLDREARLQELQRQQDQADERFTKLKESYQKNQQLLKEDYAKKIRELEAKLGEGASFKGLDSLPEEKTILLDEGSEVDSDAPGEPLFSDRSSDRKSST